MGGTCKAGARARWLKLASGGPCWGHQLTDHHDEQKVGDLRGVREGGGPGGAELGGRALTRAKRSAGTEHSPAPCTRTAEMIAPATITRARAAAVPAGGRTQVQAGSTRGGRVKPGGLAGGQVGWAGLPASSQSLTREAIHVIKVEEGVGCGKRCSGSDGWSAQAGCRAVAKGCRTRASRLRLPTSCMALFSFCRPPPPAPAHPPVFISRTSSTAEMATMEPRSVPISVVTPAGRGAVQQRCRVGLAGFAMASGSQAGRRAAALRAARGHVGGALHSRAHQLPAGRAQRGRTPRSTTRSWREEGGMGGRAGAAWSAGETRRRAGTWSRQRQQLPGRPTPNPSLRPSCKGLLTRETCCSPLAPGSPPSPGSRPPRPPGSAGEAGGQQSTSGTASDAAAGAAAGAQPCHAFARLQQAAASAGGQLRQVCERGHQGIGAGLNRRSDS